MKPRLSLTPIDRLHELLRHDREKDTQKRILFTEKQKDGSTTISSPERPDFQINVNHVQPDAMLRQMLGHYPTEVILDGNAIQRSAYNAKPSISLVYTEPNEFPNSERRTEQISYGDQFVAELMIEGILYQLTWPHYLITDVLNLRAYATKINPTEYIQATPNGWDKTHFSPLQTYRITHHLEIQATTRYQREESLFLASRNSNHCLPGQSLGNHLQNQVQEAHDIVRQHAEHTGRRIRKPNESHLVEATWTHNYDDHPILLETEGKPVHIDDGTHPPIAHAMATNLYQKNNNGMVPISCRNNEGEKTLTLKPVSVSYRTMDGEVRTATRDEHESYQWNGLEYHQYTPASNIILTAEVTEPTRDEVSHVNIEMDCMTIGTAEYPRILIDRTLFDDPGNLARRLTVAYTNKHHINEGSEDQVRDSMTTLATRILRNEEEGFAVELAQLANRFRPQSSPPNHGVSAVTPGGGILSWHPPAQG